MKKIIECLQLIGVMLIIILFLVAIVAYEYIKIAAYWKIAFGAIYFPPHNLLYLIQTYIF